ncbi:hypothetical protein [Streptomyces sp. NPDC059092]|uniref:hypothetical protein n=1 Tax=Streptomyces sp. NPDC059092 TaxID=3346725 RepID=UPI0036C23141
MTSAGRSDTATDPGTPVVQLCAQGTRAETDGRADEARALFLRLCARADLEALSLLLPTCMGSLGTPEGEERVTAALRMLHTERRLPDPEQRALADAIRARAA